MSGILGTLVKLNDRFFAWLTKVTQGWFIGLTARLTFASVLLFYYLNSAWNKLGEGIFGFLNPSVGAYASILPPIMEQYGFEIEEIPFFPWGLIVYAGTWTEILLPILIFIGLFSRLAALGMIGFIIVQTYVDIMFHGLDGKFVGAMFDRFQDAIVWDQRLMWCFVLAVIIINGPGKISLDHFLSKGRK